MTIILKVALIYVVPMVINWLLVVHEVKKNSYKPDTKDLLMVFCPFFNFVILVFFILFSIFSIINNTVRRIKRATRFNITNKIFLVKDVD